MDLSSREQRRARGLLRGAARDEDLARTVALDGAAGPAGAFDETLPLHGAAAREDGGAISGDGAFDGAAFGHFRAAGASGVGDGDGGHGGGGEGGGPQGPGVPAPARPSRLTRRRVLFAAGGLSLVGGCGVAAAAKLSGSGSSGSPSASPFGPASPSHSPSGSPSPSAHAAASSTPTHSPGDLSSSSAPASGPPDVGNPGSGVNPGKVQTAPEYYVHAGPKVIALTLDDGPSTYTPQILALLDQYKIKATFCMIGRQVASNRSLVSEVVAAGHVIVNHTWDHADQSKLAFSAIRSEISRANDALAQVGVHPSVFRAPYGAWSKAVFQACAAADLRPLDWSVDPRDWSRPGTSVIVSRIMNNTRTGSIILEHDGGGDRSQTVAALKIVLPQLLEAGYRFTSV